MQSAPGSSDSQARRNSALASALFPIADFLADERVVEVMANADGAVWVDRLGEGLLRTGVHVSPGDVERMLRLVAAEMRLDLAKAGRDPNGLPDVFYLRVGAALGGRLPSHKILLSLLRRDAR